MPKNGRPRKTLAALAGLTVVGLGVAGGMACGDDRCRDEAETARTLDGLGLVVQHISMSTNSTGASGVNESEVVGWDFTTEPVVTYQSGQTIDGWTPSLVASASAWRSVSAP